MPTFLAQPSNSRFIGRSRLANERHHEYATLEHLLLALIDDQDAAAVMRACNVDLDKLRRDLSRPMSKSELEKPGHRRRRGFPNRPPGSSASSSRAVIHVQSSGRRGGDRRECAGRDLRRGARAMPPISCRSRRDDALRRGQLHQPRHRQAPGARRNRVPPRGVDEEADAKGGDEPKKKGDALDAYCVNLNKKAARGQDRSADRPRKARSAAPFRCCAARQKNNPLFVGDAGVGKTAIAEGLARRIVNSEVPDVLRNATVFALDMGTLLAGNPLPR